MKYLVIDACLSGTGIRDKYESEFLDPEDLGLRNVSQISCGFMQHLLAGRFVGETVT
jgi:hypothetical protein